jgi:hypothetical protein
MVINTGAFGWDLSKIVRANFAHSHVGTRKFCVFGSRVRAREPFKCANFAHLHVGLRKVCTVSGGVRCAIETHLGGVVRNAGCR